MNTSESISEVILTCQTRLLKMLTQGFYRQALLDNLCSLFRQSFPNAVCSILLLNEECVNLRHAANSGIPPEFIKAIDDLAMGPTAGSCGAAVYKKAPIWVTDISLDPLWENYRDIALNLGLKAYGSTPIFSSDGQEFRNLFKCAIENSTDAILVTTAQLDFPGPRIVYSNPAFTEMTGYRAEELLGKTPRILQGPKTDRKVLDRLRLNLSRGESFRGEAINYRKDGAEFYLGWDVSPVRSETGQISHYLSIQRNISEQKANQKEKDWMLKRAQSSNRLADCAKKRLEILLRVSNVLLGAPLDFTTRMQRLACVLVPDFADWCIVHMIYAPDLPRRVVIYNKDQNKVAQALKIGDEYFLDAERNNEFLKMLNEGVAKLIPDLSDDFLIQVSRSFDHLELLKREFLKSAIVVPIRLAGKILGAITLLKTEFRERFDSDDLALAQDVADRAASALGQAQNYENAQRAIGQRDDLIAIVSHDLKNPLTSILLSAQTALRDQNSLHELYSLAMTGNEEGSEKAWECLHKCIINVINTTRRMSELIENVLSLESLDLESVESHKRGAFPQSQNDLCSIIDEVIEMLAPIAESKGLHIIKNIAAGEYALPCVRNQIIQVLSNLIGNSIKYTQNGCTIVIGMEITGEHVLVSVKDNGPGIPKAELSSVFLRHWRSNVSSHKQGTGLGLFVVKNIVEKHGGKVWAERGVPTGTSIYFTLPGIIPSRESAA